MADVIPHLLEIVRCPQCAGTLHHAAKDHMVVCANCRLCFQTSDSATLDLRIDHAVTLTDKGDFVPITHNRVTLKPLQGPVLSAPAGGFPTAIPLSKGYCLLIARAGAANPPSDADDNNATTPLNLDRFLTENAKKILAKYLASHTTLGARTMEGLQCFGFRRDPDLTVTDASISKAHCLFFFDERGVGVFDLFSRNGTYVNGKEVEFHFLSDGDIVQFGQSAVQVVIPR